MEQIDNKQWMAKEVVSLNGGMENKMLEGRMKRGFKKMIRHVFLFSCSIFQRNIGGVGQDL